MEGAQIVVVLGAIVAGFISGYFLRYIAMASKLRALQSVIESKDKKLDSIEKFENEKYDKLQEAFRTQESLLKSAIAVEKEKVETQQSIIRDLNTRIDKSNQEFEKELELARRNGLSVTTYPYEENHGDNGVFVDDRRAEIGYKFQLFVNGIPCFEAHKVPVQVLHKKEVNMEKIKQVTETTVNLIEKMAKVHPAIKALNTTPELIEGVHKVIN